MHCGRGRRARRAGVWLFGLGLFLEVSPAAVAAPFGPAASSRLPAGSTQTILLDPSSPGAQERELVLSLDGGRTFPLRLTATIGPDDRSASWRVPALPAEHAVLALREGGDGLEEEIVATGNEFNIVPEPGVPAEELSYRDGEWKTREADGGRHDLPSPSLGDGGTARVTALGDDVHVVEVPVRGIPADPGRFSLPARRPEAARDSGEAPPGGRVSLPFPLRE